jgi:hypothetical protein
MSTIKVEPFTVGNFIHAYNRGNRKAAVYLDKSDYWRFMRELRFFNDERDINQLSRCLTTLIAEQKKTLRDLRGSYPNKNNYLLDGRHTFEWRKEWGEQKPLTEIISYHLSSNHFHLLLREIRDGGISKFMQKTSIGYTVYRNTKSGEVGKVFQGRYRGKTIDDETYLQYLDAYIQVFNAFELYDGGILRAMANFDEAFQFVLNYPFCSLGESFGFRRLGIVKRDCFKDVFTDLHSYKEFCRDALLVRGVREFLGKLTID